MRTFRYDTDTAQITRIQVVPLSSVGVFRYAWSPFVFFASKNLFAGFLGLYLYLYLDLYSNDRG